MSTFTLAEAKELKGGNDEARKTLLARFEDAQPQPGEKEKIREFINDVFVKKRYVPRASRKASLEDDEVPPVKPKKPSAAEAAKSKSKPAPSFDDDEEEVPKKRASEKRRESVESDEAPPRKPKATAATTSKPALATKVGFFFLLCLLGNQSACTIKKMKR